MLLDKRASRIRLAAPSPVVGPSRKGAGVPEVTAMIRLVNFAAVRRRLGLAGYGAMMRKLATSLGASQADSNCEFFGQNLFQLCWPDCNRETLASDFATVLDQAVSAPEFSNVGMPLKLAAGLAVTMPGEDAVATLERAEFALSQTSDRQRISTAGHSDDSNSRARTLARDLSGATDRDELFLVYQPKIHVRNRAVTSAEVLVRWQHPAIGLVMPDAFIGLADISGEIRSITLWTLRKVIADQQHLDRSGHQLKIFINISGGLLTDRTFIDEACVLIVSEEANIGFEITETAVINDPDLAISNLEHCAAVGIAIAIDDYGSGLSSLAYLKRLPATELKIDKMFVMHLTSSHRDPLIVRSTIDLAHALDMEVTAEGVETPAALALLTVMGCEMVQGYLISPPLKLSEFTSYLDDYQSEAMQDDTRTVLRPPSFWKRA